MGNQKGKEAGENRDEFSNKRCTSHIEFSEVAHMEFELKHKEIKELETQIKLHINERLFEQRLISEDLYNKAKCALLAA